MTEQEQKVLEYIESSLETIDPILNQLEVNFNNYSGLVSSFGQPWANDILEQTQTAIKSVKKIEDMFLDQRYKLFKNKI